METHSIHPLCKWSITWSWKPANVPPKLVPELRNCTTLYTVLRNGIRTGVMVLDCPCSFGRPWNAAENSQRQTCKLSLTLSESTTRDGCACRRARHKRHYGQCIDITLPRSILARHQLYLCNERMC